MDIHIPIQDGIEVIEQLHQAGSSVHILVHTGESDPVYHRSLLDLNVAGVIIKGGSPELLVEAVRIAARGGKVEPLPEKLTMGKWTSTAPYRAKI